MTWFKNDAGSMECKAHLVATNLEARDENVGIENKFSRIRRFCITKSVQTTRVDMGGIQQFWIGLTTRVSWVFNKTYHALYSRGYGGEEQSDLPTEKKTK